MQVIRKINNNAALALDGSGNEVVVLGSGVGFPPVPYELADMTGVERVFYDVDPRYLEMAAGLPQPVLLACADLVEQAGINLNSELNPNLPFTLADHLNFAVERISKGINLATPLAYDVQHLYPAEYELGQLALDIMQDYTGIRLPEGEAVNVALHLVNAEAESGDMHSMMMTLQIIAAVDEIIEQQLNITLNKKGFHYSRFTMHLRYLIQRLSAGKALDNGTGSMLGTLARESPQIYLCANQIAAYFESTWGWHCSKEEILYLMLHINRVKEKERA